MKLVLRLLDGELSIARLPHKVAVPDWLSFSSGPLVSVTRTEDELSVICPSSAIPYGVASEAGWRGFKVDGKLEFSAVGILASILNPLAAAGISVLSISTFDTDYILVRTARLEDTMGVLREHFHVLD
jgi:uncharacterized protein